MTDQTTTPTVSEAQKLADRIESQLPAYYQPSQTHCSFFDYEKSLIVSALRAMPEAQGWRPIESAPKDGTEILVTAWHGHNTAGGPFAEHSVAAWDVEDVGGENGWSTHDGLEAVDFDPTHWMPLPAPPPQEVK